MKKTSLKNDQGQLLLIGGVIITFLILAMSAISISVSNINKPVSKTDFIRQDYANIREEFGRALYDKLKDKRLDVTPADDASSHPICRTHFEYQKEMFIYTAKLDGYYFNAVYFSTDYSGGLFIGLTADLTFSNEKESVSERVTYVFFP